MSRLYELFEDDNGHMSMARLAVFWSMIVASYIAYKIPTLDTLISILTAFVINYGISKGLDVAARPKETTTNTNLTVEKTTNVQPNPPAV